MRQLIKIGIDLLRFDRLTHSVEDKFFIQKNFTENEIEKANSQMDRLKYYAKVFCCKEAVFKALGITAEELKNWREIEVFLHSGQAPETKLAASLQDRLTEPPTTIQLSLSYETEIVCAVALVH